MRILKFSAKNIKKLKTVVITPKAWLISIAGKNRSGKSSTLDSIKYALFDAKTFPARPIRDGEKKGVIEIDCGDFRIRRTLTPKGHKHEVFDKDGKPVSRPMDFLSRYYCKDALDALDFFRLDAKQQRKMLLEIAGIDTSSIEAEIQENYDYRRDENREVKRLEVEVATLPHHPDAPEQVVNITDLVKELDHAKQHNQRIRDSRAKKEQLTIEYNEIRRKIQELKDRAEKIDTEIEEIDMDLFGVEELPEDNLQQRMEKAEADNRKITENEARQKKEKLLSESASKVVGFNETIQKLEQQKKDLLNNAKFPVDGLAVTDESVLFNGIPLDQVSGAERVIIGASIVAHRIPKDGLRILRVPTGSDLDSDSMKTIAEVAEREQVQIWLERVQDKASDSEYEFFLEDGELA